MNDAKFNYGMSAMYILKKGTDAENVISADPVKDVPNEETAVDTLDEDILSVPAYEEAVDEKKVKRNKIKSLIKLAVIAASIIIIIIISTIAWFTMNREVENNGLSMTATDAPFELEVRGDNIENSADFSKADATYQIYYRRKNSWCIWFSYSGR